jgi:hypothetical protein
MSPYKRGSSLNHKAQANQLDSNFRALAELEIPRDSITNSSRTIAV